MKKFQITSEAGQDMGIFEAEDKAGALDAMMEDAGYEGWADYLARCDRDPNEEYSGYIREISDPSVIAEKDLPRPYYNEDGSFNCAVLSGNPAPSRVVCVFADFEGDGEYSCPADEVGQRGNRSQRLDALVRVEITPPKQVMKSYKITSADGVDLGLYYGVDEAGALDALARDAGYEDMADALARGISPFHGSVTEEVDPLPWLQEMK